MAITFVGGAKNDSAAASSVSVTLPTHTTNDLMVLTGYTDNDALTHSITVASGWQLHANMATTAGRDLKTSFWYKKCASASETNPTFTASSSTYISATVHIFRGVDQIDPFDTKPTNIQGNNYDTTGSNEVLPGNITTKTDNACGLRLLAVTHDDITSVGTPSGYTLGQTIYGGTKDYRQQCFAYDLDLGTAGSKTPTVFANTQNNNKAEYHSWFVTLREQQPVHVTDFNTDEQFGWDDTNLVITGDGFEASQGTGKVEFWSDESGTTKVSQTIDSWGATSIQIDPVQGALGTDTALYIVVTNDSGEVNVPFQIVEGFAPYNIHVKALGPDHYWILDNSYDDEVGENPCNQAQAGTPSFVTTPITRGTTHSLQMNGTTDHTEAADSSYTNIGTTHQYRNIGGWIHIDSLQKTPAAIYEEGGGVNNFYMVIGFGNILLANVADSNGSPDFKVQAYSNLPIAINRPYHAMIEFKGGTGFELYLDGIKQDKTDGNPITDTTMSTHSGDWSFGRPDGSLDTGGTDIQYESAVTLLLSNWKTFSGVGGGAPLTATEIREELFEKGALSSVTIDKDTQANMQTDLDAYADTERPNYPCAIKVQRVTGDGDLELVADNITYHDECSIEVMWMGIAGETLTWVNENGSTLNSDKVSTPMGGTVTIINAPAVTMTTRDASDLSIISGARVLLKAGATGDLPHEDSVTITRASTTATVTHTAHGLRTGMKVLIEGANQNEYNGIHEITVTTANAYTYTVSGSPTSPATGTIKSTSVLLDGTSDVSGKITMNHRYSINQSVEGYARKGSSPEFKTGTYTGTITSTGLSGDILLIGD